MTTATTITKMSEAQIRELGDAGNIAMANAAKTAEPHWYPCGSAYVTIKIRKNAKAAKVLTELGFKWWDYHKEFRMSMPRGLYIEGMTQSMDYAARCCRAYAAPFVAAGVDCYVSTHID